MINILPSREYVIFHYVNFPLSECYRQLYKYCIEGFEAVVDLGKTSKVLAIRTPAGELESRETLQAYFNNKRLVFGDYEQTQKLRTLEILLLVEFLNRDEIQHLNMLEELGYEILDELEKNGLIHYTGEMFDNGDFFEPDDQDLEFILETAINYLDGKISEREVKSLIEEGALPPKSMVYKMTGVLMMPSRVREKH